MANLQVAYNKTTKVALVQTAGAAVPGGSVKVGEFTHDNVEPALRDLEFDVNHVLYQHVRDVLYKRSVSNPAVEAKFPENITDMASIKITLTDAAAKFV